MTAKLFIIIDAFVFLMLMLLCFTIVQDADTDTIGRIDTITEIRNYKEKEQEYKMFLKGVLGQGPKQSK